MRPPITLASDQRWEETILRPISPVDKDSICEDSRDTGRDGRGRVMLRLVIRTITLSKACNSWQALLYLDMNHSYPEHSWRHKHTVDLQVRRFVLCSTQESALSGAVEQRRAIQRGGREEDEITRSRIASFYEDRSGHTAHLEKASSKASSVSWRKEENLGLIFSEKRELISIIFI